MKGGEISVKKDFFRSAAVAVLVFALLTALFPHVFAAPDIPPEENTETTGEIILDSLSPSDKSETSWSAFSTDGEPTVKITDGSYLKDG